jgi:type I restriction enzyme R subunit
LRLNLTHPGEYELFVVLREFAATKDETCLCNCARRMVAFLADKKLLLPGWSNSKGGRMRVELSLLAESWKPEYAELGFNPDETHPPFLQPALDELIKIDA